MNKWIWIIALGCAACGGGTETGGEGTIGGREITVADGTVAKDADIEGLIALHEWWDENVGWSFEASASYLYEDGEWVRKARIGEVDCVQSPSEWVHAWVYLDQWVNITSEYIVVLDDEVHVSTDYRTRGDADDCLGSGDAQLGGDTLKINDGCTGELEIGHNQLVWKKDGCRIVLERTDDDELTP